jgi:hypothetical protein
MEKHGRDEAESDGRAEIVSHFEGHYAHGVESLFQRPTCFSQQLVEKDNYVNNDNAHCENWEAAGGYEITQW